MIDKLKNVLKKFFSKKENKILVGSILVILLIVIIVAIIFNKKDNKFVLNGIYDFFPEEARRLYSNMVSVSCYGDLHLDVPLDGGEVNVENINKNNLLDYMFSNLDKNGKLKDNMEMKDFRNTAKKLFNGNINFDDLLNGYTYGGYRYIVKDNNITREKTECVSDKNYVTHLYGYSYNINEVSINVNIGYLDNGILYDLDNNKLGKYDLDFSKLLDLFKVSSYYTYYYVKDNGMYKLKSVEWKNKD